MSGLEAAHARHIKLPPSADLLNDPSRCPWCYHPVTGAPLCPSCGFDFTCPEAGEAWKLSSELVTGLHQRVELLQRARVRGWERIHTMQREAARVASAESPNLGPIPISQPAATTASAARERFVAAAGTAHHPFPAPPSHLSHQPPVRAPHPSANAIPQASPAAIPSRPLRSPVQLLMLTLGITLLSVAAVVFLLFAWLIAGVVGRTLVIALITVSVLVISTVLSRGRLRGTAEGLAVLGSVLLLLDCWGLRTPELLGLNEVPGSIYWGIALLVIAALHVGWAASGRLRTPLITAALLLPAAGALTGGGIAEVTHLGGGILWAYVGAQLLTLTHPLLAMVRTLRLRRESSTPFTSTPSTAAAATPSPATLFVPKQIAARSFEVLFLRCTGFGLTAVLTVTLLGMTLLCQIGFARDLDLMSAALSGVLGTGFALAHAAIEWSQRGLLRETLHRWFLAPVLSLTMCSAVLALALVPPEAGPAQLATRALEAFLMPTAIGAAYLLRSRAHSWAKHLGPLVIVTGILLAPCVSVPLAGNLITPFFLTLTSHSVDALNADLMSLFIETWPEHLGFTLGCATAAVLAFLAGRMRAAFVVFGPGFGAAAMISATFLIPVWVGALGWTILTLIGAAVISAWWSCRSRPVLHREFALGIHCAAVPVFVFAVGFGLGHTGGMIAVTVATAIALWLCTLGRTALAQAVVWGSAAIVMPTLTVVTLAKWSQGIATLPWIVFPSSCLVVTAALTARSLAADRRRPASIPLTAIVSALLVALLPYLTLVVPILTVEHFSMPELLTLAGCLGTFVAALLWARLQRWLRSMSTLASALLPLAILPLIALTLPRSGSPLSIHTDERMPMIGPVAPALVAVALGTVLVSLVIRQTLQGHRHGFIRPAEWTALACATLGALMTPLSGPALEAVTCLALALTFLAAAIPGHRSLQMPSRHVAAFFRQALVWTVPFFLSCSLWAACEAWLPGIRESWRLTLAGGIFVLSAVLVWLVSRRSRPEKLPVNATVSAAIGPVLLLTPHAITAIGDVDRGIHAALPLLSVLGTLTACAVLLHANGALRTLTTTFAWSGYTASAVTTLVWWWAPVAAQEVLTLSVTAALLVLTLVGVVGIRVRAQALGLRPLIAPLVLAATAIALMFLGTAWWQTAPLLADSVRALLALAVGGFLLALVSQPLHPGQLLSREHMDWCFAGVTGVIALTVLLTAVQPPHNLEQLVSWWHLEALVMPTGLMWMLAGIQLMRIKPRCSSWRALAPGFLLATLPVLLAEVTTPTGPRAVILAILTVTAVILGAIFNAQAPLTLGVVATCLHALITFWAVAVLVWTSVPWWIWTAIAGVILVVLAATYEAQLRTAKRVATKFTALR